MAVAGSKSKSGWLESEYNEIDEKSKLLEVSHGINLKIYVEALVKINSCIKQEQNDFQRRQFMLKRISLMELLTEKVKQLKQKMGGIDKELTDVEIRILNLNACTVDSLSKTFFDDLSLLNELRDRTDALLVEKLENLSFLKTELNHEQEKLLRESDADISDLLQRKECLTKRIFSLTGRAFHFHYCEICSSVRSSQLGCVAENEAKLHEQGKHEAAENTDVFAREDSAYISKDLSEISMWGEGEAEEPNSGKLDMNLERNAEKCDEVSDDEMKERNSSDFSCKYYQRIAEDLLSDADKGFQKSDSLQDETEGSLNDETEESDESGDVSPSLKSTDESKSEEITRKFDFDEGAKNGSDEREKAFDEVGTKNVILSFRIFLIVFLLTAFVLNFLSIEYLNFGQFNCGVSRVLREFCTVSTSFSGVPAF